MVENWVFCALIVTSTMPLESEILASLRTLDVSGLLLLDSVSENLLIATTSVLMLASLWVISLTYCCTSSANAWKVHTLLLRLLYDGEHRGTSCIVTCGHT